MPRASRPRFPGYGIKEDADGLLPWADAEQRLVAARNYWLVTAGAEGPHAMPVWGLWHDGGLVFSTGERSRKARNLAADPRVVVHLESGDDVVIVEGVVESAEATAELRRAYEEKYAFELPDDVGTWYVMRPRRAFHWREESYPQTATRFDF